MVERACGGAWDAKYWCENKLDEWVMEKMKNSRNFPTRKKEKKKWLKIEIGNFFELISYVKNWIFLNWFWLKFKFEFLVEKRR